MFTSEAEKKANELYEKIEDITHKEKGKWNIIVMEDCIKIVGEGKDGKVIGGFGLGRRNERRVKTKGIPLKKVILTNTFYKCHKRYSWKASGGIDRYQIDYIIVKGKI